MVEVTVVVPWDAAVLSPNRSRRRHWAVNAQLSRAAKEAAALAWRAAGSPRVRQQVEVEVVICRSGRQLDPDNALAALKPVLDGLFGRGRITPDDSARWIRYLPVQQVSRRGAPTVVVTAREPAERW